jgi:hypothetical protein
MQKCISVESIGARSTEFHRPAIVRAYIEGKAALMSQCPQIKGQPNLFKVVYAVDLLPHCLVMRLHRRDAATMQHRPVVVRFIGRSPLQIGSNRRKLFQSRLQVLSNISGDHLWRRQVCTQFAATSEPCIGDFVASVRRP